MNFEVESDSKIMNCILVLLKKKYLFGLTIFILVWLYAGVLWAQSGKLTEAKGLLQSGYFQEAEVILDEINNGKNSEVLLLLGNLYNGNSKYKVNYKKAVTFYVKSAELGNPEAAYNLGVLYFQGRGVPQNYQKAFAWYSKASKKGFAPAQNNLGFLCQKGMGTEQSNTNAYGWYSIAAANGSRAGLKNRDILLAQLLEEEGTEVVSDVQSLALKCIQNNYENCFEGES